MDYITPGDSSPRDSSGTHTSPSHSLTTLPTHRPLKCPPKCKCRCHYPAIARLIPHWLAPYIGQVSLSKRLLHPTFSPWSLCNVQTCRGDFQRAATIQWILPPGILHGFLEHTSKDRRIHFSIGAPRIITLNSPISDAVWNGDLQRVRDLFATGKASIWDYTVDGLPMFRVSHRDIPSRSGTLTIRLWDCSMHVDSGRQIEAKSVSKSFVSSSKQELSRFYSRSKSLLCLNTIRVRRHTQL